MPNPLFSNSTSPNGATNPENPLTDSAKHYSQGYNRFNLGRSFYNTERYADISLVEVLDGVEGDKLKFGVKHLIRSYTMKDPKMFNITKKISYFMVDRKAILPINWDKVYKQPNKGDDVNAANVNTVSQNLFQHVFDWLNDVYNFTIPQGVPISYTLSESWIKQILILESIFSNGSLLASMNAHLSPMLAANLVSEEPEDSYSFDEWLERFYQDVVSGLELKSTLFNTIFTIQDRSDASYTTVSKSFLADYIRTYTDWSIQSFVFGGEESSATELYTEIIRRVKMLFDPNRRGSSVDYTVPEYHFNYSRLIAYQLTVAQFYTRDSVDDIYTAELWHQNQKALVLNSYMGVPQWPTFLYNGVKTDYDATSGVIFDQMLSSLFTMYNTGAPLTSFNAAYSYFYNILFYRRSLKFGDYFNGAKTLPLSPLDITAPVVGNGVSAIDMTRSIIATRFANVVERVSNTMKDYIGKVIGGVLPPNPLEPRFLSSVTSSVNGYEVENTSNFQQGHIVTNLKSSDSKFIYSVDVGTPCIIIGLSTYSIPLVYTETTEKFYNQVDRFDMFNKYFQNIGDQEITQFERSSRYLATNIFGFTPRNMEYKQRYNYASGGFITSLPNYAFFADNYEHNTNVYGSKLVPKEIGPEYVRNLNYELDRYFTSLTGMSLSHYFHFILKYDLFVDSSRKMDYSPSIL